ncbi:hypothetical protein AB6A40_010668 [Gnathostoma spinigerum]|uniref:Uncharacterized protein n=1 Tax=Gnathostoma spinigerum TaxID=75299 RepID=A0ABD6F202_9BILA
MFAKDGSLITTTLPTTTTLTAEGNMEDAGALVPLHGKDGGLGYAKVAGDEAIPDYEARRLLNILSSGTLLGLQSDLQIALEP